MRRNVPTISIDRLAYLAVGAFVLMVTWNGFRVAGKSVGTAFLILALVAVVAQAVVARRPVPLPPWLLAATGGFLLAALLNVIFPPESGLLDRTLLYFRSLPGRPLGFLEPRPNLALFAQFAVAFLVVPVMIASVATSRQRLERLLDLFVISAALNAFVGIVDLTGLPIAPYQVGGSRTAGLTIHPNYLALTCTVAIPLALLWVTREGRWRTAGYASTGLLLLGAYASGSRVGAVTAVLAAAVTVIAIPRLRGGLGVVVPVAGIVLAAIVLFAGDQILEQVRLSGDTGTAVNTAGSDLQRSKTTALAMDQFQARPLQGVGFGVIADAHSIYLQLLASGGIVAMAAFLTYLAGLGSAVWRARAGPMRDAAIACGIVIVMWLTNGILDNQLADKYLYVVPGLLVAMARLATAESLARERRVPSPLGRSLGSRTPRRRVITAPSAAGN